MNCPYCKRKLTCIDVQVQTYSCRNSFCKAVDDIKFEPHEYRIPLFNNKGICIGCISGCNENVRDVLKCNTSFWRQSRFGMVQEIILPYRWLCFNEAFDFELQKLMRDMCKIYNRTGFKK